jgi:TetR/AcrR family transcriptional regulator, regulator of autoinduction and epiphytic fitness
MTTRRATASEATDDDTGAIELDSTDGLVRADGRHARRDRNRYAVVDAYLALVREGNPRPSIAEVADRSGVSHRSVFRYFADKDELARTSIERQLEFARPLVSLGVKADASLDERIDTFVERRLALFEAIGPVARLSRSLAATQPIVAGELETTRGFLRDQLHRLFRAEIDACPAREREHLRAALDVMASFEMADLLRSDHGRSVADTAATWRWTLHRLLDR